MENCVVCLVQFTTSQNDISLVKITDENINNGDKIPFVYRKILRIFCEYFNLPSKKNQHENEILPSFPFCIECRNLVAELCIFHDQIESSLKLIQKTIAKITMKIVQTEKDSKNRSNSDSLENHQNEGETRNKIKSGYRRKILQNFNPRVHLTDCQSQRKKKKVNSLETENIENKSPLNDENSHGNSIQEVDVDVKSEDDRVEDDSNAEIPENSTAHSEDEENKNDSLNLNSVSLNEKNQTAREKTGESLMQQIRAKFNAELVFHVPSLENSAHIQPSPSDSKRRLQRRKSRRQRTRRFDEEDECDGIENSTRDKLKEFLMQRSRAKINPSNAKDASDCSNLTGSNSANSFGSVTPNKINLRSTKLGKERVLNGADYHSNSNANDNYRDPDDSPIEVITINSEDSQEVISNGKSPEILTSGAKDPPDCLTLSATSSTNSDSDSDSDSDKQHQNRNRNPKSLEDKMRSGVIQNVGGGKFLYQKLWPFHIIADSELFECDTCQRQVGFNKNPKIRIYTGITKHVQVEHMNWFSNCVTYESDGKFRFLDKWTFEKTELGFKCGHCPRSYAKIRSVKYHIQSCHIPGEFQCQKCPRSFTTQRFLNHHSCTSLFDVKNRNFEISPGKFVYNGENQNWNYELIDGKFQCSACPALRKDKSRMGEHIRNYHDALTTHMCDECGKILGQENALIRHKQLHLKKRGQKKSESKSPSPSVCPHCGKMCKSASGLGTHIFRSHNDIVMTTAKPTTTTISTPRENVAATEQDQGEEQQQKASSSLKYACGKCPRKFISPVFLNKHEKIHEGLVCPKCEKKFESRSLFQIHVDRHNKVLKYFCDVCNKGFLQKWQVVRHKETGAHSQKDETVNSKEKSIQMSIKLNVSTQQRKRKRKRQDESSEEEEEEESETEESEDEPADETDESESGDSGGATTEED